MTPAEAGLSLEEPHWDDLFAQRGRTEWAFESVLDEWRRWHWTPCVVQNRPARMPADAVDGIIALASLGVMPPRSLPADAPFVQQFDEHCWLVSQGRAWRILGIEDKMLMLDSFGEAWQIDLAKAKWTKYCEAAAAVLEAQA